MAELFTTFDIVGAFVMTIKLTLLAAGGSLILGTFVAVLRLSPVPLLRWCGSAYVTVLRNTPLTLIVVFGKLGLNVNLGITLSPVTRDNNFWFGVTGLTVYTASFVCEAIRSGVNTVPVGQAEAARSIGFGFLATLRYVVFPQAFRAAITPLANVLIALTKNTTVVSVIGVAEISYLMADMIEQRPDALYLVFGVVALGFVLLTLPMGIALTGLSRRLAVKR